MKKLLFGTIFTGIIAINAACSNNDSHSSMQGHDMSNMYMKEQL
ncbi:hypothetical protein [Aeribacillus pallidus]|nr:hypothetical protein [Aeribacillus pallidus]